MVFYRVSPHSSAVSWNVELRPVLMFSADDWARGSMLENDPGKVRKQLHSLGMLIWRCWQIFDDFQTWCLMRTCGTWPETGENVHFHQEKVSSVVLKTFPWCFLPRKCFLLSNETQKGNHFVSVLRTKISRASTAVISPNTCQLRLSRSYNEV